MAADSVDVEPDAAAFDEQIDHPARLEEIGRLADRQHRRLAGGAQQPAVRADCDCGTNSSWHCATGPGGDAAR